MSINDKSFEDECKEFVALKEELAQKKKRLEELKFSIIRQLEEEGIESSDGKISVYTPDYVATRSMRTNVTMHVDKAVELFKEKGFDDCWDLVITKALKEEDISLRVEKGELSEEELEDITSIKYSKILKVEER